MVKIYIIFMLFTFCSWILRFRDLQNYTTLKPQIKFEAQEQLGLPPGVILYSL